MSASRSATVAGPLRHLWWLLGAVLVVGGVGVALTSRAAPTDVGWFAYTPLDQDAAWAMEWSGSGSEAVIVARRQVVGWVVAAGGLVVLAAVLGYRLGRRATGRQPSP